MSSFQQYGQMKSRDGKRQRREEKRRDETRRDETRRDKMRRDEQSRAHQSRAEQSREERRRSSKKRKGAKPSGHMRNEKLALVVARSTFPSQNVQNTPTSDHFWKLRCRKSARTLRCRFVWQAQGIVHLIKSEQNVMVLEHAKKRWQAWDI